MINKLLLIAGGLNLGGALHHALGGAPGMAALSAGIAAFVLLLGWTS